MKQKRIFLSVSGHLKTVPMNRFVYETLKELGDEVKLFNLSATNLYQKISKKISKHTFYHKMNLQLLSEIEEFSPDIFLTIFGFDIEDQTLEIIQSMKIRTACWWLNDPFQFQRSVRQAAKYDFYFTNAMGSVYDYHSQGINSVYYLPVGIFPAIHKKEQVSKKYDIVFAGDYSKVREKILMNLIDEFDVAIFGPWKKLSTSSPLSKYIVSRKFFTPQEMVHIFNQSKIVLNIHTWFETSNFGINPRLFEACGSGAFQISDFKEDIPSLYSVNEEIVLYQNIQELKSKLSYYLSNDKERIAIAEKGLTKTLKEHTYKHRMIEMLHIING